MTHIVELLLVDYRFDGGVSCTTGVPHGFTPVGTNDVGFPLCEAQDGRLFLFDPERQETYYLAPGIEAFSTLVARSKQIIRELPAAQFASELRGLLAEVDPALLEGGFWNSILEEIDWEAGFDAQ